MIWCESFGIEDQVLGLMIREVRAVGVARFGFWVVLGFREQAMEPQLQTMHQLWIALNGMHPNSNQQGARKQDTEWMRSYGHWARRCLSLPNRRKVPLHL